MSRSVAPTFALGQAARVDAVYDALSSQRRRDVLRILAEAGRNELWAEQKFGERAPQLKGSSCCAAEVCACCFSEWLGLAPATVSHHMHRLLDAGLVSSRKEGQWVYYRLERAALHEAAQFLLELTR